MNFKPNKWIIIVISVIVLLIVLNPSYSDFKEYSGTTENLHRASNFMLFSIYTHSGYDERNYSNDKYLGILKNFIRIGNAHKEQPTDSTSTVPILDSTASPR